MTEVNGATHPSREELLVKVRSRPVRVEPIAIDGLGDVFVRCMRLAELDRFEQSLNRKRGKEYVPNLDNFRGRLLALTLSDREGVRLFTDADAAALGEMSGDDVAEAIEKARRLNGLDAASLKDAEKNSETAPDSSTATG